MLMIGAATLAGGIVIGITGGIAAPLVGGALAGLGASFFATTAGLAVITSVFGAAGAGLTGASAACAEHGSRATPPDAAGNPRSPRRRSPGYKMSRRVEGVNEFEFVLIRGGERMNVTIGISGWLTRETDVCVCECGQK